MKKMLFEFEKFEVYQRSLDFAQEMYNITGKFPRVEQFGLCSQLRRSALSVSLNLAEGFSKYHKKDKKRYYGIARASVQECVPALTISLRQDLIRSKDYENLYNECFELSRRISGLISSIDKR